MPRMHDVIVVGAGPAGLYAALRLAEAGADVLVLEEDPAVGRPTHCTGLVSEEVQSLYKIPESIVLHRPSRCVVASPGGRTAEFRSPGESIVVVDRAALDESLAGDAAAAGAVVVTGCRVETVATGEDGVRVATAAGAALRARALVLACGVTYRFHPLLRTRPPGAVLHTAQVEVAARPQDALEIHLGREVAPDGFAWLVPVQRGGCCRVKAGVLMRGDARARLGAFLERPGVRPRLLEEPGEPVRRLLPVRAARRSYGSRLVAIGDAAGLTKPVTGGGIFYSLLSAALAAETLGEALAADDLSAGRLARYETRWRQRLATELRTAQWFRHLLEHLSDRELDRFVEAAGSEDVRAVVARTARFNWHRSVIMAVLRQPGIKAILLRSLFR